jgi:hypothetical protein
MLPVHPADSGDHQQPTSGFLHKEDATFFQNWGEEDWGLRVGALHIPREAPTVVDVPVPTMLDGSIRTAMASRCEDPVVKGAQGRSGEAR